MSTQINWKAVGLIVAAFLLFVTLCVGGIAGCKEFSRYQKRADANNEVRVKRTLIKATEAEAERRYAESVGIRKAQDEINATLTPLYVQHEAIQALERSDAATVYIPSGEQGIPLVKDITGPSVGGDE